MHCRDQTKLAPAARVITHMVEDIDLNFAKQIARGTDKGIVKDIAEENAAMGINEGFKVDCSLETTDTAVGQADAIDQQHSFMVHLCSLPPCISLLCRLSAPMPF